MNSPIPNCDIVLVIINSQGVWWALLYNWSQGDPGPPGRKGPPGPDGADGKPVSHQPLTCSIHLNDTSPCSTLHHNIISLLALRESPGLKVYQALQEYQERMEKMWDTQWFYKVVLSDMYSTWCIHKFLIGTFLLLHFYLPHLLVSSHLRVTLEELENLGPKEIRWVGILTSSNFSPFFNIIPTISLCV